MNTENLPFVSQSGSQYKSIARRHVIKDNKEDNLLRFNQKDVQAAWDMRILELRKRLDQLGYKGNSTLMVKEQLVHDYLKLLYQVSFLMTNLMLEKNGKWRLNKAQYRLRSKYSESTTEDQQK